MFTAAPFVEAGIQRQAGHEVDLHTVARALNMKILAFAETCVITPYKGKQMVMFSSHQFARDFGLSAS
jgi:hypothetical protein